jgi:hypothetical protein
MSKDGATAWSTGTSFLKAIATVDGKKFVAQMVGHAVSEAAERVDETDAPLDIRIALALLKNPDTRGFIIDDMMKGKPPEHEVEKTPPAEPELIAQPTAEEVAKYQADYKQWQKGSAAHTLAETNAKNELIEKEAGVANAEKYLEDKTKAFNKKVGLFHFAAKESQKLDKAQENKRTAVSERDQAQKTLDKIQGIVRVPAPKPKTPKPKTVVGKVGKWIKENVSVSGEAKVASVPLYQTRPTQSSYSDTQHQIAIESAQLPNRGQPSQHRSNMGQWENVQASQAQQMFNANMAYQSPVNTIPSQPLNFGNGVANNAQLSHIPRRQMQMAGFMSENAQVNLEGIEQVHRLIANDFTKSIPKGAAKVMAAVCTLMVPDMSDMPGAEDPQEHFKRAFNHTLKKYDQLVKIQDPNSFGSKAGEFVGEMVALGGVGKVIRVAEGISVLGMACEGGFVGAIVSEAHDTNMVAGIAFGFVGGGAVSGVRLLFRGGGVSKPLIDRALSIPQGFGQQIRAIESNALRSGFASEGTVSRLADRSVNKIRTDWVFPKKGGATINGRWYTEHALERMAPRTPRVMAELERRFLERAKAVEKTLPPKRFRKWYRENYPNPRGIPPSVVEAEISKPGSTNIRVELNQKGDVITAIPGGKK